MTIYIKNHMKIRTIFNLDDSVVKDLDDYSKETLIYKSKLVNKLLREYLDKNFIKKKDDIR